MEKKSYTVVKAFPMPNGEKAAVGTTVELTREQAKYLLLGGKIVDAAMLAPAKTKSAKTPKTEEVKGE